MTTMTTTQAERTKLTATMIRTQTDAIQLEALGRAEHAEAMWQRATIYRDLIRALEGTTN